LLSKSLKTKHIFVFLLRIFQQKYCFVKQKASKCSFKCKIIKNGT